MNRVQDMNQKIINWGVLMFVDNPHIYQALESNYVTAARATGAHEALFSV